MAQDLLVATRKGLFTVNAEAGAAGARIVRNDFLGDNVSMVLQDARDGSIYAALEHGHFGCKLHRAAGTGQAWQALGVPTYPKQPEGQVEKDQMGRTIPWSLTKMWCLESGGADMPGELWCGTIPGGLFRSTDHGASWQIVEPLWRDPTRVQWLGGGYDMPGIHSIAADPRDPATIRVAVSTGGVWVTRDRGATWTISAKGMRAAYMPPEQQHLEVAQDVHRMVQCRADPSTLWVQHHNGIFRSSDAGASWLEIEEAGPSTFGFAAAVHPDDPAMAWFAPAIKDELRYPVDGALVVTRTRDGGKTFEILREGLPQTNAYHLIYRHGLAVDRTGQMLAMGSTTGGLWMSDNGGNSWSTVSHDLPPIHALRFAA